jgi:hypothetical protein
LQQKVLTFGFWLFALPFGYYATIHTVYKFDELRQRAGTGPGGEEGIIRKYGGWEAGSAS